MNSFKQRSLLGRALGALTVALLVLGGSPAHAIPMIYVTPDVQTVQVGDTVSVDVMIGGLRDEESPSLGAFDITVSFDASILGSPVVLFGSELGGGLQDVDDSVSGLLSVAETSLLFDDLDSLQPAMFSLFTLKFAAIAAGSTAIGLDPVLLVDASVDPNVLIAGVAGARINVEPSTAVPAPATIALLLLGLAVASRRVGFARRG